MDEKSKRIEELKNNYDYYKKLLHENVKSKDEQYSGKDVLKRIEWHKIRMECAKELGINII